MTRAAIDMFVTRFLLKSASKYSILWAISSSKMSFKPVVTACWCRSRMYRLVVMKSAFL